MAWLKLTEWYGLKKMKTKNTKAENRAQAEAFCRIKGNVLDLIALYAADFRDIITEYEAMHEGHVPSADDLLWIESQRQGRDITLG
jgi:hypothetical protein